MAENVELKDYKFGYQFNFNVIRKPNTRKSLEPYVLPNSDFSYVSPDKITVLQGQSLELFCIHSGLWVFFVWQRSNVLFSSIIVFFLSPDKIPRWKKASGDIDYNRVSWSTNFKKSIKIDQVKIEDEGTYSCDFDDTSLNRQFDVTVDGRKFHLSSLSERLNYRVICSRSLLGGGTRTGQCKLERRKHGRIRLQRAGQTVARVYFL